MRDLHLSDVKMGFVFSAFTLAYGLFEIPTGWWGERIGTRQVLTRIVVWWSSFTAATAAGLQLRVAARGPVRLRDGRSGGLAERRPDVLALVPGDGAGLGPRASSSPGRISAPPSRRSW